MLLIVVLFFSRKDIASTDTNNCIHTFGTNDVPFFIGLSCIHYYEKQDLV